MSYSLIFENFPISNIAEVSSLTADSPKGQANIEVANTDRLDQAGAVLLIGSLGSENAEKGIVLSIVGNVITLNANKKRKHVDGEFVYRLKSDQVRIYRAVNVNGSVPVDGSFIVLDTVDIQVDQLEGEYVDAEDGNYWYKLTYYNSQTLDESPLSESKAVLASASQLYVRIDDVRIEAGLRDNSLITDTSIGRAVQLAQARVNSSLSKAGYTLPLSSIPELIEQITLRLAAGYTLRSKVVENDEALLNQGKALVEEAEGWLTDIETGKLVLFGPDGTKLTQSSSVLSTAFSSDSEPWFTRDKEY